MQHEQKTIIEALGTFLLPIDVDSILDDDVILLYFLCVSFSIQEPVKEATASYSYYNKGMETNT
ncbi:hypothetical protein MA16_Dca016263 [Dendrobium catenatum]|uniref:Uncharacterized protein n=1 Tax=Dendrobium catenatum TaxID=906689 RepID=A0A2I0W5N8_9ASPA|nr:hypothetical protein MA16_Dca016263 [Dendrobium catenatum]